MLCSSVAFMCVCVCVFPSLTLCVCVIPGMVLSRSFRCTAALTAPPGLLSYMRYGRARGFVCVCVTIRPSFCASDIYKPVTADELCGYDHDKCACVCAQASVCSRVPSPNCGSLCFDGVMDGGETGVDCGGNSTCGPCGVGQVGSRSQLCASLCCRVLRCTEKSLLRTALRPCGSVMHPSTSS